MNPLEQLAKEHETIERELIELETVMDAEIINYGNLKKIFNNLGAFWEKHEKKEEELFGILQTAGFKIPVKKISFEHSELGKSRRVIIKAMSSGSEFEVKKALDERGRELIESLRGHIQMEDWIIYGISWEGVDRSVIKRIEQLRIFDSGKKDEEASTGI